MFSQSNSKFSQGLLTPLLSMIAMMFILIFAISAEAENNSKLSKSDFDQIEREYVKAAFGENSVQLRKFFSVTPLSRSVVCKSTLPDKCLATVSLFKHSLSESHVLRVTKANERRDLELILADNEMLPRLRTELAEIYHNGTIDSSSADCQFYVKFAGQVIVRAVTVISVDANPLRAQTCFLFNFYRSLGLTSTDGKLFADVWGNESNPKLNFTQAMYEEMKFRMNVLLTVHACKKLQPGMTKNEVERELNPQSECLKALQEVSNG